MNDVYYRIKIRKSWFRGKNCFPEPLSTYERRLVFEEDTNVPLCAGNMIYRMMQLLEKGVDWQKQTSLMAGYRHLVYRLSYSMCSMRRNDLAYVFMEGRKSDVMWALSFMTQLFPDEPMRCKTISIAVDEQEILFRVMNGDYTESTVSKKNGAIPDIWSMMEQDKKEFDPYYEPQSGDEFVIPDGRQAKYLRMDERYYLAKSKGGKISEIVKHNISASFIKDFENMIRTQTKGDYDVYQMRYKALMNKAHEIENMIKGFEPSVYDILPVGERGLPLAESDTIVRTNLADANSISYIIEELSVGNADKEKRKELGLKAVKSIAVRQQGYEAEYRSYIESGTDEDTVRAVYNNQIERLYTDFAKLDVLRAFKFSQSAYRDLCNVPVNKGQAVTDWERKRIRLFGKGYLDFLSDKLKNDKKNAKLWNTARKLLDERYIKPLLGK